jgi:hypothetical protein
MAGATPSANSRPRSDGSLADMPRQAGALHCAREIGTFDEEESDYAPPEPTAEPYPLWTRAAMTLETEIALLRLLGTIEPGR